MAISVYDQDVSSLMEAWEMPGNADGCMAAGVNLSRVLLMAILVWLTLHVTPQNQPASVRVWWTQPFIMAAMASARN